MLRFPTRWQREEENEAVKYEAIEHLLIDEHRCTGSYYRKICKKNYVKKKFLNQWFSIQIADETYIKILLLLCKENVIYLKKKKKSSIYKLKFMELGKFFFNKKKNFTWPCDHENRREGEYELIGNREYRKSHNTLATMFISLVVKIQESLQSIHQTYYNKREQSYNIIFCQTFLLAERKDSSTSINFYCYFSIFIK